MSIADRLLELAQVLDPGLRLNHRRAYIGLVRDGQPNDFVKFIPRREHLILELRLKQSAE